MCWTVQGTKLFLAGTLLFVGTAAPAQQPDPPPVFDGVHSSYSHNLLQVVETIEAGYLRPVSRADLLCAALTELYRTVSESAPSSLRQEAEKAVKASAIASLVERTYQSREIAKRVSPDEALLASCRAMLSVLDPYCEVVEANSAAGRIPLGRLPNFGTGIDLEETGGGSPARIKDVQPGSPAQRAGLRPGDRITAIDAKPLENLDAYQATLLLNRGDAKEDRDIELAGGIPVLPPARIVYERDGEAKPHAASVERRPFQTETVFGVQRRADNSWDYWIDRERKIAQIRLGALGKDTADDLRQAVSGLQEAGMRGLLLDLRWCPGGLLDVSVKSAGLFLDKCRIFSAKYRAADRSTEIDNPEPGPFRDFSLLVLVNAETSGGGELIAAALQDHQRAAIAGQRTRGKASVQIMRALPCNGAYLKLTNAIFLRPSGKNLHRFPDSKPGDDWGVRPDDSLDFRVSAALSRQLRDWWAAQTLRPGGSSERLPLDDPNTDPQRQLALQALREQIK